MRLHILGICGTFMGGIARLAQELGHQVTGSDNTVYPPMSIQLGDLGIDIIQGFDPTQLEPAPDLVVIGNALSRGNPAVEAVLDRGLPYISGPQWLSEHVLMKRRVIAVAGTHGKTTVASLIAWILENTGAHPGFLIGGVPVNFGVSARVGEAPFFVIEADEYDTAFFDKRAKFVHYRPQIVVLNNLEFDHADIFNDLDDIKRQFHHLIRTVPGRGILIVNGSDANLQDVMAIGCWSNTEFFYQHPNDTDGVPARGGWAGRPLESDYTSFEVNYAGESAGTARWSLIGRHNMSNAIAAIAAVKHAGVTPELACSALTSFSSVKRRLENVGSRAGIHVYDDFAHHPTEIRETLAALRRHVGGDRIIAVVEPRSNTMRMGIHRSTLSRALTDADLSLLYQRPDLDWNMRELAEETVEVFDSVHAIVERLADIVNHSDHIVIMSNGEFGNLANLLLERLKIVQTTH